MKAIARYSPLNERGKDIWKDFTSLFSAYRFYVENKKSISSYSIYLQRKDKPYKFISVKY